MKNNEIYNLDVEINLLKSKQLQQLILLKEHFQITADNLKTKNIIKNISNEAISYVKTETNIISELLLFGISKISKKTSNLISNSIVGRAIMKII